MTVYTRVVENDGVSHADVGDKININDLNMQFGIKRRHDYDIITVNVKKRAVYIQGILIGV